MTVKVTKPRTAHESGNNRLYRFLACGARKIFDCGKRILTRIKRETSRAQGNGSEYKSNLLTHCIAEERKRFERREKTTIKSLAVDARSFLQKLISEIYIPSWKSFFAILVPILAFALLGQFLGWPEVDQVVPRHQYLIEIHAGIGAIIFALIIFVAESLRDDELKDKARVLLKESYLFPLVVAEILAFFVFILSDNDFWNTIPVIIIGGTTIWSLSSIIRVLLNKHQFAQKRIELLQQRLRQSIDLAIDERIGRNILHSRLDSKDIKLAYSPYASALSDYYCFYAKEFGIVCDINLDKLKEIADLIEEAPNQNGFLYIGQNDQRYLVKTFQDPVDEENHLLICIHKGLIKVDKIDDIKRLVAKTFIIKPKSTFAREIRHEISGVKDQFIFAIANKQLGKIDEMSELYIKLAEAFLEHLAKYGNHSAEQAYAERNSIWSRWEQVGWLSSDIRDIFMQAMNSHEREVIRKAAYIPIAIATRAIRQNDHYLFQEFIGFAESLYFYSTKCDDEDIKDFLIDRSWRYIKEVADFHIESKLLKGDLENPDSLKDFGVYIFKIFQGLLKNAFDRKDIVNFDKFRKETRSIFRLFNPSKSVNNMERMQWDLEKIKLTSEQRVELMASLKRQSKLEYVEQEISTKRKQMFFGLASWILDQLSMHRDDTVIKQCYALIEKIFSEIALRDFTNIFLKAHDYDTEKFWGWD